MTDKQTKTRTRSNRRRENNKIIYGIIALLVIVLLILLVIFIQSNNDKPDINDGEQTNENTALTNDEDSLNNQNNIESETKNDVANDEENNQNEANEEADNTDATPLDHVSLDEFSQSDLVQVNTSNDEDVIESYVANWQAVGTSQTGEHNSNFDEASPDRIEINQAITAVTKLTEDQFTQWWVGNDGFNKAFTDIEEKATGQLYRLFLTWHDGSGWQVTQVDKLARSEHKEKWSNNQSDNTSETNNEE